MRFRTRTGSIYEVDGLRIRKLHGGSGTKRVTDEWRDFVYTSPIEVGRPVYIHWGTGRDAVSDELGTPADCDPSRLTITSVVEELNVSLPD